MAKYLRPRRGSKDSAFAQKILLKKGEVFLEFPNSEIGRGPGRLVVGDGATSYQNMNYSSTATNVFRPFITDPELFVPRFDNSTYQTSGWTVDAGTEAINAMGDGSSASTVAIPTLIGNIKNALCKHANSIIKINNDVANKADKTIFNATSAGLVPQSGANTDKFLKGDGSWDTPNASTFTASENGLVPSPGSSSSTFRYLRQDGSWAGWATSDSPIGLIRLASATTQSEPENRFLDGTGIWRSIATAENHGLLRKLPTTDSDTKYLNGDGTWKSISNNYSSTVSASTAILFTQTGAYNLYKGLNNDLLSVGWVSSPIEYDTTTKKFSTVTVDLNSGTHSKPGYKPIAVVGFNTGTTDIYPNTFTVRDKEIGTGQELYVAVHNISENSGTAASAGCNILWIKNSVS